MIISHKHKFIYFKAEKVAGTSTEILLSDLVDEADTVTPITKGDSSTHKPRNYNGFINHSSPCLLYTSPSPRDRQKSRMPSSA